MNTLGRLCKKTAMGKRIAIVRKANPRNDAWARGFWKVGPAPARREQTIKEQIHG